MPSLATWLRAAAWFWSPDSLYLLGDRADFQGDFNAEELNSLNGELNYELCSKRLSASVTHAPTRPSEVSSRRLLINLESSQQAGIFLKQYRGTEAVTVFLFALCSQTSDHSSDSVAPLSSISAVVWTPLILLSILMFRRTFNNI